MRRLTLSRLSRRRSSIVAVLIAPLSLVACGGSQPQESSEPDRYISTTGEGEISATPDRAEIQIEVENEAERAAEALRLNRDAMTAVLDEVASLGLDRNADIRTLQVSVRPRYERVATQVGGPRRRTLVGYAASNAVMITVKDIDKAPDVLDALANTGSNRTDSVSFYLDEREALEDQARVQALADARRKAALLAAEAGMRLGTVRSIVENRTFAQRARERSRLSTQGSGAPIAPGEQSVQVNLTARWDLLPDQ
ncbi:MAG: SIMPL domain-containing protein [Pseudomonadota bacterium]